MIERSERLRKLLAELAQACTRIGDSIEPKDAVRFLDRLARCEAFSADGDHAEPIAAAVELRKREAAKLGDAAAEALDPDDLFTRAYLVAGGVAADEAKAWMRDLLRAVTAAPWVAEPVRSRLLEVADETVQTMEANPGSFLDAATVLDELAAHEHPERLACADLVEAGRRLPELASVDSPPEGISISVRESVPAWDPIARLEEVLHRVPRETLEGASAALAEAEQWWRKVVSFRRAAREERGREPALRLAAQPRGALGEHLLLRRLPEGELILSREGESLFLDWYAADPAQAGMATARLADEDDLIPIPLEGGRRWLLPDRAGPLPVELRVEGSRVAVVLPA